MTSLDAQTPRQRAQAAALDQQVIGDAAAVLGFTMHRATWGADPLGLRERGVGAFFDEEVADLSRLDTRHPRYAAVWFQRSRYRAYMRANSRAVLSRAHKCRLFM